MFKKKKKTELFIAAGLIYKLKGQFGFSLSPIKGSFAVSRAAVISSKSS